MLGVIAGCPSSEIDEVARVIGPSRELAALIDAPVVDLPEHGALSLANTDWIGSQDCTFYGDSGLSFRYIGWTPQSGSMRFDDLGFPSGFAGTPYTLKRAAFTDTSFDAAYTVSIEMADAEGMHTISYVFWQSGKLEPDGHTLTGRLRVGAFMTEPGLNDDVSGSYDCTFTMSPAE